MSEEETRRIVTLQCEKHGEYSGEAITIPNFLGMGEREFFPLCPECEKETAAEKEKERARKEKESVIRKWRSMNIGKLFYESTLDNFNAYNNELKKHLETCRAFAENPSGKLVMLGEHGNGKTHLAVSVLKKVGGCIYTATEIAINIKDTYNGIGREKEVFDELCGVPLLVIDEVEKVKESEWKSNWMSHIVGKRYNEMLPIIFIGNCHRQARCVEPDKPCNRCLEYHLENDVLSRIVEDGNIMEFNSADYRKKIGEARFGAKGGKL